MRKAIIFLSMVLLFLGTSLANPPPVFDIVDTQTEKYLSGDLAIVYDVIEIEVIEVYTLVPEVTYIGDNLTTVNIYKHQEANLCESHTGKILRYDHSFNEQTPVNRQMYIQGSGVIGPGSDSNLRV